MIHYVDHVEIEGGMLVCPACHMAGLSFNGFQVKHDEPGIFEAVMTTRCGYCFTEHQAEFSFWVSDASWPDSLRLTWRPKVTEFPRRRK